MFRIAEQRRNVWWSDIVNVYTGYEARVTNDLIGQHRMYGGNFYVYLIEEYLSCFEICILVQMIAQII